MITVINASAAVTLLEQRPEKLFRGAGMQLITKVTGRGTRNNLSNCLLTSVENEMVMGLGGGEGAHK